MGILANTTLTKCSTFNHKPSVVGSMALPSNFQILVDGTYELGNLTWQKKLCRYSLK